MTAKEYLEQAYRLNELINSDLEELGRLRQLSISLSSLDFSSDIVSGSRPQEAKFTDTILKIINLEEKINDEIDKLVDLQEQIRQTVDDIEDKNYRLLLRSRYILFKTWDQIAETMNFTPQWVQKLHKKALTAFSEKFIMSL